MKNDTKTLKEVYVSPSTRTIRISVGRVCIASANNTLDAMDVNEILDEEF